MRQIREKDEEDRDREKWSEGRGKELVRALESASLECCAW